MSTAHRPNFDPAKGRASKVHLSAQTSKLDIPSYTKLKFRQPPSTSTNPSSSSSSSFPSSSGGGGRRDLKRDLALAEWESTNRKRAKAGLQALPPPSLADKADEDGKGGNEEDEEERKRKEAIQKAIELDRDSSSSSSSSDSDSEEEEGKSNPTKAPASSDSSESDSESEDDDQEDEQAALLRELEKIRAERLATKQRTSTLNATQSQLSREEEIAHGNPLLNLQNAFHPSPAGQTSADQDFQVKRRWDDDVIFKNQAAASGNTGRGSNTARAGAGAGFVNDLTRSDFHKKFMNRYIK